jgi:hypothetical protein
MGKNIIHVYHSNGLWKVRRLGSKKASRVFNDKVNAIRYAEEQKMKNDLELFVHNVDGSINANDTYYSERIAARSQF